MSEKLVSKLISFHLETITEIIIMSYEMSSSIPLLPSLPPSINIRKIQSKN